MQKIIGRVLIILGLIALLSSAILYFLQEYTHNALKTVLRSNSYTTDSLENNRLIINRIDVELPISISQYSDNSWESNYNGVSYLASSPEPGEMGNSVLYGHNWKSLLGRISELEKGDEIIITFDNNLNKFKVIETKIVTASDVSILSNSTNTQITLYTCTGFLDTKRFVVIAERT